MSKKRIKNKRRKRKKNIKQADDLAVKAHKIYTTLSNLINIDSESTANSVFYLAFAIAQGYKVYLTQNKHLLDLKEKIYELYNIVLSESLIEAEQHFK